MNAQELKQSVREKYSAIALQSREQNAASCCGATGCCSTVDYAVFAEDYTHQKGYVADADLGLGCGLPTAFAQIREGDTVVDLGSGAGNDCFVAREIAGATGRVIGIDFTEVMIERSKQNAGKLGFGNVQFRLGEIEDIPIANNSADVVISNCVLNLVPDKRKAFSEVFRILKPGGHFSVSDVVLRGELPDALQHDAELYAGCVSGAIQAHEYLEIIRQSGFEGIAVQQQKSIVLPNEILMNYLSDAELQEFKSGSTGLFSITVYAQKPVGACCAPGSNCC